MQLLHQQSDHLAKSVEEMTNLTRYSNAEELRKKREGQIRGLNNVIDSVHKNVE